MRIDQIQKVYFEISDPNGVTPRKANPLLKSFKEKLDNFVFDEYPIFARIVDVDEFFIEQISPNLICARYEIVKWDIIDKEDATWVQRFNNSTRAKLAKLLKSLKLKHYKTILRVTKVAYI